ncbi:MAG: FeoB-associated Cys-rich membrane protein [Lachnospiraceae bacterium]|nr:FeoB-associated Cys-rich membrane protein [Lachnospiraceae bacterium]
MATVIVAIIVFGIVGLDVWYLLDDRIHHKGKTGCSGCSGNCSGCGGDCSGCGGCH